MDLEQVHKEMVAELSKGQTHVEEWDKWYGDLPHDIKYKLSLHDFKRLGECFKAAFNIR